MNFRIGRLHIEFIHDLHLRIFRAFASLGFDDHDWLPTDDLQSLLSFADIDLGKKQLAHRQLLAKLNMGNSQGFKHPHQKTELEKKLRTTAEEIEAFANRVQPYKDVLARRAPQKAPQAEAAPVNEVAIEDAGTDLE